MFKKKLFLIFCMLLIALCCFITAHADETGSLTENITYTFDYDSGDLRIVGSGSSPRVIPDYTSGLSSSNPSPFFSRSDIKRVFLTNISRIGSYTFTHCHNLNKIIYVDTKVTSIGEAAFAECGFTSLQFPANISDMGTMAFGYNNLLADINFPTSLTYLPEKVLEGCGSLTTVKLPKNLTEIGKEAFHNCPGLESITIPEGVKTIGDCAFQGTGLVSVTLPKSLTVLGTKAFCICSELESADLSSCTGLDKTGISAFENCLNLDDVSLPNGLRIVSSKCFYRCQNLSSVYLPGSVKYVNSEAFIGCVSLTYVDLGYSVTNIGESAFSSCTSLKNILIPESVLTIGDYAFSGCTSLVAVHLSSGISKIGNGAFANCSSLTAMQIPKSVTSLGTDVFSGTPRMCILCAAGSAAASYADSKNYPHFALTEPDLTIPSSVKDISAQAFEGTGARVVSLSRNVRSIGYRAFANCDKLRAIYMTRSVTSISDSAFADCTGPVVIMGDAGTYAQKYALSHNLYFAPD